MDKKLFTELVASVKEMKEIQAAKRKSARQLAVLGGSQPHLKPIRRRRTDA